MVGGWSHECWSGLRLRRKRPIQVVTSNSPVAFRHGHTLRVVTSFARMAADLSSRPLDSDPDTPRCDSVEILYSGHNTCQNFQHCIMSRPGPRNRYERILRYYSIGTCILFKTPSRDKTYLGSNPQLLQRNFDPAPHGGGAVVGY